MGFFKKISRTFKKVAGVATLGLVGGGQAPVPQAADAPVAAAPVETPTVEQVDTSDQDTDSSRKRARATGKKALSVSRSAGNGVNI